MHRKRYTITTLCIAYITAICITIPIHAKQPDTKPFIQPFHHVIGSNKRNALENWRFHYDYQKMYLTTDCWMTDRTGKPLYSFKTNTVFYVTEQSKDGYLTGGHTDLTKYGYFKAKQLSETKKTDDLPVDSVLTGNYTPEIKACIDENWYKLPRTIRQRFLDEQWTYRIADTETIFYRNFQAGGITYYADKYILFPNSLPDIQDAFLHETGHFVDYMVNLDNNIDDLISISSEFNNQCYLIEKNTVDRVWDFDIHGLSTPSEYFADCFQTYILYPDALHASAPNTYQFIDALPLLKTS